MVQLPLPLNTVSQFVWYCRKSENLVVLKILDEIHIRALIRYFCYVLHATIKVSLGMFIPYNLLNVFFCLNSFYFDVCGSKTCELYLAETNLGYSLSIFAITTRIQFLKHQIFNWPSIFHLVCTRNSFRYCECWILLWIWWAFVTISSEFWDGFQCCIENILTKHLVPLKV